MKEKLGDAWNKLEEEVYTYDERTTKGMARFKTTEAMREYMTSNAGKHKHEFRSRRIYIDIAKEGEDAKRERAVQKAVHLMIKHGGGNAEAVKKELDISYKQGDIWKGDVQLADWDKKKQNMTL